MTQPITSKLAAVAECMDFWVRAENDALWTDIVRQAEKATANEAYLRQVVRDLENRIDLLHRTNAGLLNRVAEVEYQLEDTLDRNERLVQQCTYLETSILLCPTHPGRAQLFPDVQRRLDFEVVDLVTDDEMTELEDNEEQ